MNQLIEKKKKMSNQKNILRVFFQGKPKFIKVLVQKKKIHESQKKKKEKAKIKKIGHFEDQTPN